MDWKRAVKRLLGVGSWTGGPDTIYRCLKCGSEYAHEYEECPSCGVTYVVEVSD